MAGKGFSTNDFTDAFRQKLERLQNYDDEEIRNMIESFEMFVNNEFLKTNSKVSTNTANIQALQAKGIEHDASIQELQTSVQNLQSKDEEHDETIQALQSKNEELKAENEAYKSQLPAGQKSGEYITLTDSSDLVFDEIKVFGNSRQEKRSGKNKFDMSKTQQKTSNGVTCTYDEINDVLTFNGACTADNTNFTINDMISTVKDKTTLTVYCISGTCTIEKYAGLRLYDANWGASLSVTFNDLATEKMKSSTYSINNADLVNWNFRFDKGTVLNNFTIKVMLTDEVDTEYEQFGLAPSPEFKSEVEALKEANIVVCNKNKLKLIDNELSVNGVSIKKENGKILLDGACTATNDMIKVGEFFAIEGKKYIMSINQKTEGWGINTNSNSAGISTSFNIAKTSEKTSGVMATATKTGLVSIYLAINKDISFDNFELAIQIEEDEVTELIANEQQNLTITAQQKMFEDDYFDLKNKKEVHVWKKKILDGTEDYNISSVSTDDYYAFQTVIGIDNDTAKNKLYCEELVYDGFQGTEVKDYENIALNSSNKNLVRIWIKSNRLTAKTVVALKNYLSEHNITFYYKSIAPTSLACTETQVQQLEAIEKAHGYKTITNIYCTDSLSANMQVTYRKDLETYINNKDKEQDDRLDAIEQLLSTTQTSALLLDNMQVDLESEV